MAKNIAWPTCQRRKRPRVELQCRPERSEGPHIKCERYPNVLWVIDQPVRGPSPSEPALSERTESNGGLGMTPLAAIGSQDRHLLFAVQTSAMTDKHTA